MLVCLFLSQQTSFSSWLSLRRSNSITLVSPESKDMATLCTESGCLTISKSAISFSSEVPSVNIVFYISFKIIDAFLTSYINILDGVAAIIVFSLINLALINSSFRSFYINITYDAFSRLVSHNLRVESSEADNRRLENDCI